MHVSAAVKHFSTGRYRSYNIIISASAITTNGHYIEMSSSEESSSSSSSSGGSSSSSEDETEHVSNDNGCNPVGRINVALIAVYVMSLES